MSITQNTPRASTATSITCSLHAICVSPEDLPPIGPGFEVDVVPLPATPTGITEETRRRIAITVIQLQRGATPEDIASGRCLDAWRIFDDDELERAESLAHADLLLSVMVASAGQG